MLNMFITTIILIFIALHEVKMSSQGGPLQSTITKRTPLSSHQITCIVENVVTQLHGPINAACHSVPRQLGQLYSSIDVVQSVFEGLNNFPVFCHCDCGQVLININYLEGLQCF